MEKGLDKMNKIVLIGAGSVNFGLGTLGDIFKSKILEGSTITLHDINPKTLDITMIDYTDSSSGCNKRKCSITKDTVKTYTNPYRDIDIHVIPSDRFRITFMVEYNLPALGSQYEAIYNMEEDFAFEVAPARTFCFLSEVEMLKERGLIKGGGLENAVVIIDK